MFGGGGGEERRGKISRKRVEGLMGIGGPLSLEVWEPEKDVALQ